MDGENVDLVIDAHRLSEYFDKESFDLVISFAVFEHLAMPSMDCRRRNFKSP